MSYELTGKLLQVSEVHQVNDRFKKREFVLERERMGGSMVFTDYIKFQLVQDRVELVNDLQPGEMLKVNFDIRGNKWEKNGETMYFTNLEAWKIEKAASEEQPQQQQAQAVTAAAPPPPPANGSDVPPPSAEPAEGLGEDDLPF